MKVELGEELDTIDPFPVDYKPPPKTIHIIAQPPSSPATTGKCLPMVYLSNKKFALSHILYFFIRSEKGKRPLENSDEENESQAKKGKLIGIFFNMDL